MKLLLVEDHPDVAEVTLDFLREQFGVEASWAASGEQALSAAASSPPDLFLIDLRLPDMSGLELARQLRAETRFRTTTLIALSGYSDPQDKKDALAAGFNAFYTKPMDLELLMSVHGVGT